MKLGHRSTKWWGRLQHCFTKTNKKITVVTFPETINKTNYKQPPVVNKLFDSVGYNILQINHISFQQRNCASGSGHHNKYCQQVQVINSNFYRRAQGSGVLGQPEVIAEATTKRNKNLRSLSLSCFLSRGYSSFYINSSSSFEGNSFEKLKFWRQLI